MHQNPMKTPGIQMTFKTRTPEDNIIEDIDPASEYEGDLDESNWNPLWFTWTTNTGKH